MVRHFINKFTRKSFSVPLEDKYCYPCEKDFEYANTLVMQAALENFCIKEGSAIEYISKEKPIRFILNGKEKYEAQIEMGRGRFNQGYYIRCVEIID